MADHEWNVTAETMYFLRRENPLAPMERVALRIIEPHDGHFIVGLYAVNRLDWFCEPPVAFHCGRCSIPHVIEFHTDDESEAVAIAQDCLDAIAETPERIWRDA